MKLTKSLATGSVLLVSMAMGAYHVSVKANTTVTQEQNELLTASKYEYALGKNGEFVTLSELSDKKDKEDFITKKLESILYRFEYDSDGKYLGLDLLNITFDKNSKAYVMMDKGNAGHYDIPLVDDKGNSINEVFPIDVKDTDTMVMGQNYPEVYIYSEDNIFINKENVKGLSYSELENLLIEKGDIKGMDFSNNKYSVELNLKGPDFYNISQGIPGTYTLQYDLRCAAGYTNKKISFTIY
ncbi:hypothetical protein ACI1TH_06935 [Lactococcus petauri]|uniref:hypothetical protein n=1 Tax=Lactococcus petauri TaxID=1940789 RepID=UPI0038551E86